jgi:methionyl-tRNA formyltransferase
MDPRPDEATRTIALPDEVVEALFGPYDENLRFIESVAGVHVATQGHDLHVTGDAASVARVEQLVGRLLALQKDGYQLSNGDVKTAAELLMQDPSADLRDFFLKATLRPGGGRRTVSARSLNQKRYIEAIELIKKGTAPRVPQDESQATYEGLCTEKDAIINWSAPIDRAYNLIRGTNPQPGATTYFRGKRLKIFDAKPVRDIVGGLPGQIIDSRADGFVVSLRSGAILVQKVQMDKSSKVEATEFARQAGLAPGVRLGE